MNSSDKKISEDRGRAYGNFQEMSATAQKLKKALILPVDHNGYNVEEAEAIEMICTKLARIKHGDPNKQFDSWTDIIGYANLARESRPDFLPKVAKNGNE